MVDDLALRPKIAVTFDHCSAVLAVDEAAAKVVHFNIGAAKTIDGLFWIADKK